MKLKKTTFFTLLFAAPLSAWAAVDRTAVVSLLEREWGELQSVIAGVLGAWTLLLQGMPSGEEISIIARTGLPLLLLLPLRSLSRWFAAWLTGYLRGLHNQLVSGDIKHKGLRALTRFVTSITPLVPWLLLLWVSLLVPVFPSSEAGPGGALPLLYAVYVIYVLVNLSLEWFLLSACQGAGSYLNSETTELLERRSHSVTSLLLLPWVVITLSEYLLQSTAVSHLIGALVWLFSWLMLSYLLHFYREPLVINLKRLTPERFDPVIEPLAAGRITVFLLPLLIPLNLVLFFRAFLEQLLGEFAWYQRLSARWFRMRNQLQEDAEEAEVAECTDENYLRWFESYGEAEYPIINTGLSDVFQRYYSAWIADRGDDNVLLMTGEPGIGKKSAVKRFCKEIAAGSQEVRISMLDIPARTLDANTLFGLVGEQIGVDLADGPVALANANEALEPTVLVLNNAENLFLADVGALDAWQALLSLTNARAGNLFWMIVMNNQSWAYLCNVFGRDYQMRNVVRVKRWTQAEIRSLILSRNQQSGYRLRYDDVLMDTRAPANNSLRNAEQRYFSLLWDASRGVPVTALRLWQESVTTRRNEVTVRVPRIPSGSRIEKSGSNQSFILAAIVTHGTLNTAEIMRVTNLSENVVRFSLKATLEDEIVEKGEDGRYRITALWYHTVVSILNRMNMLHE
ncbi:MAG: hypothetical protein C9355_10760 [Thalassolituus maritimus]|nr:MAG: hypothetical protein C9355_10760 [Thalassolituus maritimus]